MQRWIVAGVVALALLFGGGFVAYRSYKESRPHPVWIPLAVNRDLSEEKILEVADNLKAELQKDVILTHVSRDLGLAKEWNVPSDKEAAAEIRRRLFVKPGETSSPMGRAPSIDIGVKSLAKEKEISEKIVTRLMEDVWPILGVEPPRKK